ncbi:uncharacterized protein LOC115329180 [Ixodes scapularis]|uniref:uncharacterized protein LOC115329180 n=1 Tax=Ixodes scapularis TaxID=6945 RepID=UPI001A9F40D2|nr:uncharacterized protein LOC115329180 [Ixodes scapularis]
MTDSTESTAALASLQLILGLLESSDSSDSESSDSDEDDGDTSSSSSSDDEAAVLGEVFAETFALPAKRPKITRYVEDVLRAYSDEEFRRNFRLQREPAYAVIERYERSAYYRGSIHGGSNPKTAEVCILSFLWYAGNKTCIRDVAGRFDMGESTLSRILNRVAEFLCSIAPDEIRFPDDVAALAKDFEEVSGFPGVVGNCVDGSYIGIRCPDNKCSWCPALAPACQEDSGAALDAILHDPLSSFPARLYADRAPHVFPPCRPPQMSTDEIAKPQQTVAGIATSVMALTTRIPPLATEEVEPQNSKRSDTPNPDPLGSAEEPHSWLGTATEGRPREVDPAVLHFLHAGQL